MKIESAMPNNHKQTELPTLDELSKRLYWDGEAYTPTIEAELAIHLLGARTRIRELEAERDEAHKKIALIFDQSCYSDSLGVEGPSFTVCRWCGGGSGPGGNPSFKHNDGCLLDNDTLEKEVHHVWEDAEDARNECDPMGFRLAAAEAELAQVREKTIRDVMQAVKNERLEGHDMLLNCSGEEEECDPEDLGYSRGINDAEEAILAMLPAAGEGKQ